MSVMTIRIKNHYNHIITTEVKCCSCWCSAARLPSSSISSALGIEERCPSVGVALVQPVAHRDVAKKELDDISPSLWHLYELIA